MDAITGYAMNLLTLGLIMQERISEEDKEFKRLLVEIKNNGKPANYCRINEVFNIRNNEIYMLKEAIDSLIERVNSRAIADSLRLIREELAELAINRLCFQTDFQGYLFCPAMNRPETSI